MSDVGQVSIIVASSDPQAVGSPGKFRINLAAPIMLQGTWEMALLNISHAKGTVGNSIFVICSAVETTSIGSNSRRLLARLPPTQSSDPAVIFWELRTTLIPWRPIVTNLLSQLEFEVIESTGAPVNSATPVVLEVVIRPVLSP